MDYVANSAQFSMFYNLPFWLVGMGILVLLLLAVEAGYRTGLWRRRHRETDAGLEPRAVILTSMLALLGLILAFTYSYSASRFEDRKHAVVLEANALGTAFLRANLIPEPDKTVLKNALYEYATTRLRPQRRELLTPQIRIQRYQQTLSAQARIWPITERIALSNIPPGPSEIALVTAINEVLDMHTVRLRGRLDTIPGAILWLLALMSAATLGVAGYNAGISSYISRWRMTIFSVVLTGIMAVIVDFDRPTSGFILVDQFALYILVDDMRKDIDAGSLSK